MTKRIPYTFSISDDEIIKKLRDVLQVATKTEAVRIASLLTIDIVEARAKELREVKD